MALPTAPKRSGVYQTDTAKAFIKNLLPEKKKGEKLQEKIGRKTQLARKAAMEKKTIPDLLKGGLERLMSESEVVRFTADFLEEGTDSQPAAENPNLIGVTPADKPLIKKFKNAIQERLKKNNTGNLTTISADTLKGVVRDAFNDTRTFTKEQIADLKTMIGRNYSALFPTKVK